MSDKELQTLPSSLREKQRYIVFDIIADESAAFGNFVDAVWDTLLDFLGEKGAAEVDPWILKDLFDEDQQRGGIRVRKDYVEDVRAALALITEINGETATIQVISVTGTMDSARKKYFS